MSDTVEIEIEKLASGGDGLGSWKGKRVFVPLSLPGERVRARIERDEGDYLRASLEEVLVPSDARRKPECPLYAECGGCTLQHATYGAQIEYKRAILAEAVARAGGMDGGSSSFEIKSRSEFACRARFQFHGSPGGPGLMARGSSRVVPLSSCPLATLEVNEFLGYGEAAEAIPPGSRRVVFGSSDGLFVEGRDAQARAALLGTELAFPCSGFFQSNLGMLEVLASDLAAFVGGGDSLADLYGGVGTFSSVLAPAFARVCLVEENAAAAACAEGNLRDVGARVEIHASRIEDWIGLPGAGRPFDVIVCDPPRTGLSPSVRRFFAKNRPIRLAYVSCDPISLSRDLGFLLGEGYRLDAFVAYDFYPQTAGLECLAVLGRKGSQ